MLSGKIPSTTSFQAFGVYFKKDKALERLVLPQLDILLDKPSTFPKHVYSTVPLRIHRVFDVAHADIELLYDVTTKTLTASPRGPVGERFEGLDRLPPTFHENSLRQVYGGSGRTLPPLAEYIYDAARAFALLKHKNVRDGPLDMRSEVAVWMSSLVRGPGLPPFLPTRGRDMIPSQSLDFYVREKGCDASQEVGVDEGYGILVGNNNPNALYVAVVKIPSSTLKPVMSFHTKVAGDGGEALLFERDIDGDVRGMLRFELHAGQSFNVDKVVLALSSEPIEAVEEMLAGEKVWDALVVTAVCQPADDDDRTVLDFQEDSEEQDIADALVRDTKTLKL
ncbi:hypothetical protein PENSPDRAFT_752566 [Peniophora sp. CONT]|nr:hypothetical protein PENSPDRAFT_752566 [Peniophora sp. CONT]